MFTQEELANLLYSLLTLPAETEIVEFKKAENTFSDTDLGEYFSALANEANLKGVAMGWLVFGVDNSSHKVVGSNYKPTRPALDEIKKKVADHTTNRITFDEIYELMYDGKRVVMFQIPAAPQGMPIAYKGHFYGRDGESLVALNLHEIEQIRAQANARVDWSAEIVSQATIDDLDPRAIEKARTEFGKRNPGRVDDLKTWDDQTFLNKAKITIRGQITRAALILLGKEESEFLLSPYVAKIRWSLKTLDNANKDYEVFSMPLLLSVDSVYNKIRNIKYRYVRENSLFPEEMLRYDMFNIREPLNNCIAHQDYTKCARIEVVEYEDDHLVFQNHGSFLPQSVESVIENDCPESFYRNRFLVEAMRNLNMIETEGGGIKKMFEKQRIRMFPLPEYDLSNEKVRVEISGRVLDEKFANILTRCPDLSLFEIMLLDKVQKRKLITDEERLQLKKRGLIEGRKPNYYLSDNVVRPIGDRRLKAEYIKNRSFDDKHYKDMVVQYISKYGKATKDDVRELIWDKLSPVLNEKQKASKIQNLLSSLRIAGMIEFKQGFWMIKH